jgi:gluconate:H+ symporter, GntP family
MTVAPPDYRLLGAACLAVILLVLLVTRWRWNPALALLLSALLMGGSAVMLGVTPATGAAAGTGTFFGVFDAFQTGFGRTMGGVAPLVFFGAVLGRVLADSGGATVLGRCFASWFGPGNAIWCISALAITVGLTTWFAVGLYLLLPILFSLTRETGRPFLTLAIPMVAFLSVMHGLVPPHPGPVIAVATLEADTGKTLLWALLLGLPVAAICGPLLARHSGLREHRPPLLDKTAPTVSAANPLPGVGMTLFTVALPILLMLASSLTDMFGWGDTWAGESARGLGHPLSAMLIGVLFSLWSLGLRLGRDFPTLMRGIEQSGASVGMMLIIVGAGGGFGRVLTESGVADVLGGLASQVDMPIFLYGWLAAAFIRVSTGSATVAITVASEMLAPAVANTPEVNRELLVVGIGFGSLFLSHVNDGGFWIVRESLGLSVRETLLSWTIAETIIGLGGLGLVLGAAWLL